MPTVKKRPNFLETEEGQRTARILHELDANTSYNTESGYSADTATHPTNRISFVDKHMKYLSEHQSVDLEHYLSNLRLMTRI